MKSIENILKGQRIIKHLLEADHHTGSLSGLHPKNALRIVEDNFTEKVKQNKIQRWLWKNRLDDLSTIGKVDVYQFIGDGCEGQQLRIAGRTITDTDTDNQVNWEMRNIQIALDMCKPKYFLGVNGTPYHIRAGGSLDYQVYKGLEAENKNIKFIYADNLIIKIGELIYSIAHPYPSNMYKSPPLEKLITQHATEYYLNNAPKIQVFVRAHAHMYNWLNYRGGAIAFVVPCQQPTSKYARTKPYLTVRRPDVGVLQVIQKGRDLIPKPFIHKLG